MIDAASGAGAQRSRPARTLRQVGFDREEGLGPEAGEGQNGVVRIDSSRVNCSPRSRG